MSTQYVRGLQFAGHPRYLEAVATCKHFDAYTGPENIPESRFTFDSVVSWRDWKETFQPAFKGLFSIFQSSFIKTKNFIACGAAGALSFMCSYNKFSLKNRIKRCLKLTI